VLKTSCSTDVIGQCHSLVHLRLHSDRKAWLVPSRDRLRSTACSTCATLCYMRSVSHREMRNSSGEILRAVAAGESIQVTNNGQVAAVIVPPLTATIDDLVARGQARRPRRALNELSMIRRRESELSSAALVADARGRW
jgi:prevent-host-death family protein